MVEQRCHHTRYFFSFYWGMFRIDWLAKWQCRRKTTNPSGFCWKHRLKVLDRMVDIEPWSWPSRRGGD